MKTAKQLPVPAAMLPWLTHATHCLFVQVTVPFLRSEYGKDYDYEAPVKLLDAMMHAQADRRDQQARCPLAVDKAKELKLREGWSVHWAAHPL